MKHTTHASTDTRRFPWRIAGWSLVVAILLAPLIAMQFTSEVNWSASDFLIAGFLLGSTGAALELSARKTGNSAYRAGVAVAVIAALLVVWINGAVGIIGNENNPANLMFGGVVAVGLVGAVVARFRPLGMARAMTVAAVAQAASAVVALIVVGLGREFLIILFFSVMWMLSAQLFRSAADQDHASGGEEG